MFGPGYRANATLGRALRLLMINVGGAEPCETSMSTFGHLGRYTYCIAENEEASPWPPYHASHGFPESSSASHSSPAKSRTASPITRAVPRALAGSLGWSMAGLWNSKHVPLYSHTTLVVGPEHARTFADDGWSPADLARHLHETVRRPSRELLPDETHGEGTNLQFAKTPPATDAMVPEFPRRTQSMSSWPAAPPDASRWRFPAGWEP